MSLAMISLVCLFLIVVFWQFGARLSARYSLTWVGGAIFLFVCTVAPEGLHPVAALLGIDLVSNLVIAGLILFLFFQTIDLTSDLSKQGRTLRLFVANDAVSQLSNQPLRDYSSLIVLPCFNESENLENTVGQLKALQNQHPDIDFLIVNDGSTDHSAEILQRLCPKNFVSHKVNIGVAGVLLTGFTYARTKAYELIIQCDSDGQHPISLIPQLIAHAKSRGTDLLIGSRFCPGAEQGNQSTTVPRLFAIGCLRIILYLFGRSGYVSDPTSGLRVYSRRGVSLLLENMPDDYPEPESIALAGIARLSIEEYPVTMTSRTAGVSSLRGLRQIRYFVKVATALAGLRLRYLFGAIHARHYTK